MGSLYYKNGQNPASLPKTIYINKIAKTGDSRYKYLESLGYKLAPEKPANSVWNSSTESWDVIPSKPDFEEWEKITLVNNEWVKTSAYSLAEYKTNLIGRVKADAYSKIISIVPEWKQRNLTARGVQLLRKMIDDTASAEEIAEANDIETLWGEVKDVRNASDAAETSINAVETHAEALSAYNTWKDSL